MIKESIQYIVGLGNIRLEEVDNQVFSTQKLHTVEQAKPDSIIVRNLSGLVDYLQTNFDKQPPVLVQIASPTEVNVLSTFNRDYKRNHLIQASAMLPSISFARFLDVEDFNILLQSCFVASEDRAAVLQIVGNIREENVSTVGDNGVTQQVTAKTGVTTVDNIIVPNPVTLKPYRTFVEVEQPASEFVFRMKTGPEAALFEADGGSWKLTAIARIKEYLLNALSKEIESGAITIIA